MTDYVISLVIIAATLLVLTAIAKQVGFTL